VLIILDRDGVINEDRADFVKTPDEMVFIDGALQAIARLNAAHHQVVIATNQSCIGRGIITEDRLNDIHEKLLSAAAKTRATLDRIYFAPDAPWAETAFRKPGPGMLQQAMQDFRSKPAQTVMIGDSLRDLQAAQASGCHRILVQTGKGRKTQAQGLPTEILPVAIASDLTQAVQFIEDGRFQ
jgi:D-glycero-D-manno-heptose 1,7-bisphosphate phosphatase